MTGAPQPIEVALAVLNGKVDTVIARMEAGDRQGEQLVALVKDQLTFLAADTGELKAVVREQGLRLTEAMDRVAAKSEQGITTVRLDLERQIKFYVEPVAAAARTVAEQLEEVRLWRAKVVGIAIGVAALSSGLTAALLKAVGS